MNRCRSARRRSALIPGRANYRGVVPGPVLRTAPGGFDFGAAGATLPAVPCSGNRLDQIALRSQFGHWALRSEGAWGIFRVPHSLLLSPALAQDWRGFFVKCAFTPAASFFANAVMARLIASVIVATALAACAGHVADWSLLLSRVTSSSIFCL